MGTIKTMGQFLPRCNLDVEIALHDIQVKPSFRWGHEDTLINLELNHVLMSEH
jgi:hypothetical protein